MSSDLRSALNHALCDELDAALGRVMHCLDQLSDAQVWHRPPHGLNAVGNLLLHLAGNIQQVIADNLLGTPDTRVRQAEFDAREPLSKDELLGKLAAAVQRARTAILSASDERLAEVKRVNNNDWTGIQAAVRSIAHFRGHTQEIIHMTRALLGDSYEFVGPK
jgi:uncharacterized damage-inducible protein DinB